MFQAPSADGSQVSLRGAQSVPYTLILTMEMLSVYWFRPFSYRTNNCGGCCFPSVPFSRAVRDE